MHVFEGLSFFTICLKKLFFFFEFLFTIVQFNVICRFQLEVWSNLDGGGGGGGVVGSLFCDHNAE